MVLRLGKVSVNLNIGCIKTQGLECENVFCRCQHGHREKTILETIWCWILPSNPAAPSHTQGRETTLLPIDAIFTNPVWALCTIKCRGCSSVVKHWLRVHTTWCEVVPSLTQSVEFYRMQCWLCSRKYNPSMIITSSVTWWVWGQPQLCETEQKNEQQQVRVKFSTVKGFAQGHLHSKVLKRGHCSRPAW